MELSKIREYLVANPGALLIIVFLALILMCAPLMIQGNNTLVESVAVSAYCFLVVGVILQAAKSLKEKYGETWPY